MKTTLFLILSLLVTMNVDAEYVIEKTGFYGVYVKSMPCWTFWNYRKVINALAESSKKTPQSIQAAIELGIPVLCSWNHGEALQCKAKVEKFNAELEIREIHFVCKNKEEADATMMQLQMVQLTNKLKTLTSPESDLDYGRDQLIKLLEDEIESEK
jgi:hypothetical protein